jgi:hypothetical protein
MTELADSVKRAEGPSTADGPDSSSPGQRQSDDVIDIGRDALELFHDEQERPHARRREGGPRGAFKIPSRECRRLLQRGYREEFGRYPSPQALTTGMDALAAEAVHEGPEEKVFLRVGGDTRQVLFNLADDAGRVVEAARDGWRVRSSAAVQFARRETIQAVPAPREGGSLDLLREFINVETEEDFILLVSWLVMTLCPSGPYPVLILQGEQGSAKSTASRVMKALADPVAAPVRSAPTGLRDLAVAAESNWVLVFDNLSGLPPWLSDAICRLSTGGGFGTRALYTDDEERVFDQMRPVILNGIDGVATRQDLLDRAIVVRLPKIPDGEYVAEATFWTRFEAARPQILGALFDGVSHAVDHLHDADAIASPRMADFARWASAAAPRFGWTPDAFITAYEDNRATALRLSLDGSIVASKLDDWLREQRGSWEGTPTQLHGLLKQRVAPDQLRRFPANAQALSRHLTLLAPALRTEGISVEFTHLGRGKEKMRWLKITDAESGTEGTEGTQEVESS